MLEDKPSVVRRIILDTPGRHFWSVVALGSSKGALDVSIEAPGVEFVLNAVFVCSAEDVVDVKVNLVHAVGGSSSRQLVKGVAGGNSRVDFNGLVKVAPDAQKTDASQTSATLLLSEGACVQTSPQLEIYADDVKCSHGAAVGNLDENEQFYMRSRGISLKEARRLQIQSFIAPVEEGLPDDLRRRIDGAVSALCG